MRIGDPETNAVYDRLISPTFRRVRLAPGAYAPWLDPAVQQPDRLQPILRPYPAEAMMAYRVSPRVNNPLDDRPECIEPLRGVPDLEPGEAARRTKRDK